MLVITKMKRNMYAAIFHLYFKWDIQLSSNDYRYNKSQREIYIIFRKSHTKIEMNYVIDLSFDNLEHDAE